MTLNVKLKGVGKPIQVSGSTFEENEVDLSVKDGTGKVTARFSRSGLVGWWLEKEYELTEEDKKRAREGVEMLMRFDREDAAAPEDPPEYKGLVSEGDDNAGALRGSPRSSGQLG
jgi:hypothetical protein